MLHIKIFYVGKTKEAWLSEALLEYQKRVTGDAQIEWIACKSDEELVKALAQTKGFIALDPKGKTYTSEAFSTLLHHTSKHTFVIGGPEGLPPELRKNTLSFSTMTFTHQMIRLLLAEQLYRAIQIEKGTPYHK